MIVGSRSVNASSTDTLLDIGAIPSSGIYVIFLTTQAMINNCGAAYLVRLLDNNYVLTPLSEGTSYAAPRINNAGYLRLNTQADNATVVYLVLKIF